MADVKSVLAVTHSSAFLRRNVRLDCYFPRFAEPSALLLFNDGQDLAAMGLETLLEALWEAGKLRPLVCVGIHAGKDRLQEYGTAVSPDFKGRGSKAFLYTHFIVQELLPFLQREYGLPASIERAFAGFSLGGLSAMDIVWNHPWLFRTAGVFSGSLWWRSKGYEAGYDERTDRLMHAQVGARTASPDQRFFFECGTRDETADRNNNGVIDSIDDTLDLMAGLRRQGAGPSSLRYLEVPGGRHDAATWARALPEFLQWAWGMRVGGA